MAYNSATSYALGALASRGSLGGTISVFKSLQAGNAANTPESSPTWWQAIGDTYGTYDVAATYALGHRVIDPAGHAVYESQLASNTGQPLGTGTAWLKLDEPTNRWCVFDQLRNTQATAPVDMSYVIAPGQRVSTVAVVGLDAHAVDILVHVAGELKYSRTENLKKRKSFGWRDYLYGAFAYRKNVQYFDLPPYRNAEITVVVRKSSGTRRVGGIHLGNAVYIGDMQYKARSDHLNFSVIERDKFGRAKLDPERSVPKAIGTVLFPKKLTSRILQLREETNGRPAVWSGLDDFSLDYFEPLFIFGLPKEFSIDLESLPQGVINLEVEEL
ncbi:hypothetical protein [Massilia endophytica]|uniref:hypothetical protein n=1 Tax=Massilia endophytica TaxID=2899220 RepID=UPI001E394ECA|nr:hypothetical protein [Massilia endophytica]UGQ45077.1 hypothetical protein LSQ66_14885 [Massilia endophytica]